MTHLIFFLGSECLAELDWSGVPRPGDGVQLEVDNKIRTFWVQGVLWTVRGEARIHIIPNVPRQRDDYHRTHHQEHHTYDSR
jgi:hypothetical protein